LAAPDFRARRQYRAGLQAPEGPEGRTALIVVDLHWLTLAVQCAIRSC